MYVLRNAEDSLSNYSRVKRGLNINFPHIMFLDLIVHDLEPCDALGV